MIFQSKNNGKHVVNSARHNASGFCVHHKQKIMLCCTKLLQSTGFYVAKCREVVHFHFSCYNCVATRNVIIKRTFLVMTF